jgi:four helix bundle protein
MKNYRDLKVWEKAHGLTLEIYRVTVRFPREELYGRTSQMRRCSASIGTNMAEGCGKRSNAEFQRFLQIASGSASELDYHLLLARDLKLLTVTDYDQMVMEWSVMRRMLTALLQKVDVERSMAKC